MITPDEQQITRLLEVLDGMKQGRKWQRCLNDRDGTWNAPDDQSIKYMAWCFYMGDILRLEPFPPPLRDWNGQEDVFAVGPTCWLRKKDQVLICARLIVSVDCSGVITGHGMTGCAVLFKDIGDYLHSPTGTAPWKPCTVEVRA